MGFYQLYDVIMSCHQDMADFQNEDDNVTCLMPVVEINGVQYRRQNTILEKKEGRCHDCRIKHGGFIILGVMSKSVLSVMTSSSAAIVSTRRFRF